MWLRSPLAVRFGQRRLCSPEHKLRFTYDISELWCPLSFPNLQYQVLKLMVVAEQIPVGVVGQANKVLVVGKGRERTGWEPLAAALVEERMDWREEELAGM